MHISLCHLPFPAIHTAHNPIPPPWAGFECAAVGDSSLTFTLLAPKKPYKEPNFKCSNNNNKSRETLCYYAVALERAMAPVPGWPRGPLPVLGWDLAWKRVWGPWQRQRNRHRHRLTQLNNAKVEGSARRRGEGGSIEGGEVEVTVVAVFRRHLIACDVVYENITQISRIRRKYHAYAKWQNDSLLAFFF